MEQRRSREGLGWFWKPGKRGGLLTSGLCRESFPIILLKQCSRSSRFLSLSCAESTAAQKVSCARLSCREHQLFQGRGWSCLVSGVSLVFGDQSPADGGTPKHRMRGKWLGPGTWPSQEILGPAGGGLGGRRSEGQACWGHHLRTAGTSWAEDQGTAAGGSCWAVHQTPGRWRLGSLALTSSGCRREDQACVLF